MSVGVISLVVWLVLVFLSVTTGIEQNWLKKLTALHAPVRLAPTPAYYQCYFYQIDALSESSHYTYKTIGEKYESPVSDPYAAATDVEIPPHWPLPNRKEGGELSDPVKGVFHELSLLQQEMPGIVFQDYEMGGGLMRLQLPSSASLSQMTYLLSIPDQNPRLHSLILSPLDFEEDPLSPPPQVYFVQGQFHLPDFGNDTAVLLPKNYLDSGVTLGMRGTITYQTPTSLFTQEQKTPIRVAGFYDPGVMAVGNKCLLAPKALTRAIHGAVQTFSPDGTPTNGIFVWTPDIHLAKELQTKIAERLRQANLS